MWNRHLDEFQNLEEIHAYYRRAMSLYQSRLYPMEECNECSYRELWNCQGGCLTHTVMKHGELSLDDRPGETTGDGFKEDAVLALSPDVEIRRYDMPEASCAIFNKVSGVELEMDGSFQPLLLSLNGQFSAREVVDQYIGDNAPNAESASELATLTQGALRQGASELLLGMLHQGLVVERHV